MLVLCVVSLHLMDELRSYSDGCVVTSLLVPDSYIVTLVMCLIIVRCEPTTRCLWVVTLLTDGCRLRLPVPDGCDPIT